MGDRVLITFKSGDDYTPFVYMHWCGEDAPDMIKEAQPLMRRGDNTYAAARFCGFCHEKLGRRTTGLGLINFPAGDAPNWDEISHGDAGVYVVDVDTGAVEAFGGYGKPFEMNPANFGE